VHETVCCFAEEFARRGYDGPKILRMFQNPFYAAAHSAYLALGHDPTAGIIDRCLTGTGRARVHGERSSVASDGRSAQIKPSDSMG
jgi:hypothetical protein